MVTIWQIITHTASFLLGWLFKKIVDAIPLPENWKVKIQFVSYDIWKRFRPPTSDVTYVFKTASVEYDEKKFYEITELVKDKNFILKSPDGEWLQFSKDTGIINPTIVFMPVYLPTEEGRYLSAIEFQVKINVDYNNFLLNVYYLLTIKHNLQLALIQEYGEFIGESITCKLSSMYKFSGILSEFNLSTLRGTLNGRRILFNPEEVTVIGPINQEILSLLKKIIAFYY